VGLPVRPSFLTQGPEPVPPPVLHSPYSRPLVMPLPELDAVKDGRFLGFSVFPSWMEASARGVRYTRQVVGHPWPHGLPQRSCIFATLPSKLMALPAQPCETRLLRVRSHARLRFGPGHPRCCTPTFPFPLDHVVVASSTNPSIRSLCGRIAIIFNDIPMILKLSSINVLRTITEAFNPAPNLFSFSRRVSGSKSRLVELRVVKTKPALPEA